MGLVSVLKGEPGFIPVAAAADSQQALIDSRRAAADVALVDYHLKGGEDGLLLGLQLKQLTSPPRVVIYSGYAKQELAIAAAVAGADALVDKGAPVDELFEAVRGAARGERNLPSVSPESLEAAGAALDTEDLPLLGMAMAGEPVRDIASTVGSASVEATLTRLRGLVLRLGPQP